MQESINHLFRQFAEGNTWIRVELFDDREQCASQIGGALFVSWSHEGEPIGLNRRIRTQLSWIDFHDRAQPVTTFTSSICGVERKRSWLQRRHVNTAVNTCHPLRVELLFAVDDRNQNGAARQFQSGPNRIREALTNAGFYQQTIDNCFDG